MKKQLFLTKLVLFLIPLWGISQPLLQKVYPGNPSKVSSFGGQDKRLSMDDNTLIVADPDYASEGCTTGFGAVMIYKKNQSSQWILSQTLMSSYAGPANFGTKIALHKNLLIVSAPGESKGDTISAGAIYVYKRNNAESAFVLQAKIQAPKTFNGMQLGGADIALNSNYIVATVYNRNQFMIFKIDGATVSHHKTVYNNRYGPAQLGITENNIVAALEFDLLFYKIEGQNVSVIKTVYSGYPYNLFNGNLAVDGNTVVVGNELSKYVLEQSYRIFKTGYNTVESVGGIHSTLIRDSDTPPSIVVKENKYIFITKGYDYFNSTYYGKVLVYKYIRGQYRFAGSIDMPQGGTTVFGYSLAYANGVLAASDPEDNSNTSGVSPCTPGGGKGAISLFSIHDDFVSNMDWAARRLQDPLQDADDNLGRDVSISSNFAAMASYSDDVHSANGGVFLYSKTDAKWQFSEKLVMPINRGDYFYGNSVALSNDYLAVGAPTVGPRTYHNGAVILYSLGSSGFVESTLFIEAPAPNYDRTFGEKVALSGNTLVVSSPAAETHRGGVDVFQLERGSSSPYWPSATKVQTISHPDLVPYDRFGSALAIKGDYILVGAPSGSPSGVAYMFKKIEGTYQFYSKFSPSNGTDLLFGSDVALSNDYAFVASGNGTSVYVYKNTGAAWTFHSVLSPFQDKGFVKVAVEGTQLLVSTNNDGGQAKVIRYNLYGNTWTKTGGTIVGPSSLSSVPVDLASFNETIYAYQSNETTFSYGLINSFSNLVGAREGDASSGASEVNREGVVSPNPFSGEVLSITIPGAETAEVTNSQGQIIKTGNITAGKLNLSGLTEGVYLIRISSPQETRVEKLIVK